MPLGDLNTLINSTSQNLSQLKAFSAIYNLLQTGVPNIAGLTNLININNDTNFGSKTADSLGPVFNIENVFINVANALFQGNPSAQTAFNNLAAGITLSDKLTSIYQALVDPSEQTAGGLANILSKEAFYKVRADGLGIPGETGGAVVGFASLLNILVKDGNIGIGNSVQDLVKAIADGSAALPETSTTFIPIETADGTNFDSDDAGAASTILLTTNADTPGAAAPSANTLGTSAIDTYTGLYDPSGGATTLSNSDTLNGEGNDADVLNLRVASTSGNDTIAPTSTKVENFFITNQQTSNLFTLDFQNIQDEKQVWDKGSVENSSTKVINVDMSATVGMESTLGFYEVNFSGDRSGTTDAFTLALNGAGNVSKVVNFSTITTSGAVDNTFEIANISSNSALSHVSLGVDPMTLKTINVSGDAQLLLFGHNNFEGLSKVDASAMTGGGLNIDAKGSTETGFQFTGSEFSDRVVLMRTTIDTSSSLNGGTSGKDTIATTSINNLQEAAINAATGFEVLENTNGAKSFDASKFTNIHEFLFTGTTSTRATFSNVETADRIALSTDIKFSSYGIRVEGKNAGTNATIELRAIDETNGETVIYVNDSNNSDYGIELRTNISTLSLDSTGTNTNANLIEVETAGDGSNYAIGNSNTALIKITGSQDLTILAKAGVDVSSGQKFAGFSNAANIDASDFTGDLRIAGSNSSTGDVIMGGSGKDIIYGMSGSNTLTGNGDTDQFRLASYNRHVDTITDFEKSVDKVGLNQFDFSSTTATQAGAVLSTNDYIENINTVSGISGAEDKKLVELQSSLSATQITGQTSTASAEAFVLVHNTTSGKAELWYDSDWSTTANRDQVISFDNIVGLTGVTEFSNTDFVEYSF